MLRIQCRKVWLFAAVTAAALSLNACASGGSSAIPDRQAAPADKNANSGASAGVGNPNANAGNDGLTRAAASSAASEAAAKPQGAAEPVKAAEPDKPSEPKPALQPQQSAQPKTQSGAGGAASGDRPAASVPQPESSAAAASGAAAPGAAMAPAASPPATASAAQPPVVAAEPSTQRPAEAADASQTPQAAQSAATASSGQDTMKDAVSVRIVGDKEKGTILDTAQVQLQNGDTVIDVLKRIAKENKIQLETRGNGKSSYIEGIANLYEFDKGAKSGWLYRVNGKFPNVSAGAYTLNKGDRIEWLYTLNLGKDVGKEPDK